MPVIPDTRKLKQEDDKFKASLGKDSETLSQKSKYKQKLKW
jgi:hypothetical protein